MNTGPRQIRLIMELRAEGINIAPARIREVLGPDIRLNAQGLLIWKQRAGH